MRRRRPPDPDRLRGVHGSEGVDERPQTAGALIVGDAITATPHPGVAAQSGGRLRQEAGPLSQGEAGLPRGVEVTLLFRQLVCIGPRRLTQTLGQEGARGAHAVVRVGRQHEAVVLEEVERGVVPIAQAHLLASSNTPGSRQQGVCPCIGTVPSGARPATLSVLSRSLVCLRHRDSQGKPEVPGEWPLSRCVVVEIAKRGQRPNVVPRYGHGAGAYGGHRPRPRRQRLQSGREAQLRCCERRTRLLP